MTATTLRLATSVLARLLAVPLHAGVTRHVPTPTESMLDPIELGHESTPVNTNRYDVAYTNTPLSEIIRDFSELVNVSLVTVPADVEGSATVNLRDVIWQPALQAIVHLHGVAGNDPGDGRGASS